MGLAKFSFYLLGSLLGQRLRLNGEGDATQFLTWPMLLDTWITLACGTKMRKENMSSPRTLYDGDSNLQVT